MSAGLTKFDRTGECLDKLAYSGGRRRHWIGLTFYRTGATVVGWGVSLGMLVKAILGTNEERLDVEASSFDSVIIVYVVSGVPDLASLVAGVEGLCS